MCGELGGAEEGLEGIGGCCEVVGDADVSSG